jgi:ParB-like nuclease domain
VGRAVIGTIIAGARGSRTLGDLTDLAGSIAVDGQRLPVTISPRNQLITGARRLAACEHLGWVTVPATVIATYQEAVDVLNAERADGLHARPMTGAEIIDLETVMAAELEWWPRQPPGNGPRVRGNERRAELARALGVSTRVYREGKLLTAAARGEEYGRSPAPVTPRVRQAAQDALAVIRAGMSVSEACRQFTEAAWPAPAPRPNPRQRQAVTSALGTLAGIAEALARTGPLDPAISPDVIAGWDDAVTEAMGQLRTFRRTLREGT